MFWGSGPEPWASARIATVEVEVRVSLEEGQGTREGGEREREKEIGWRRVRCGVGE